MKQEDKDLLLRDLCARLPYGVKVLNTAENVNEISLIDSIYFGKDTLVGLTCENDSKLTGIEMIKPYLFPLSSMTEEQKKEYNRLKHEVPVCYYEYGDVVEEIELFDSPESFEYLIKNHFDYYGLIPKELAIDCTNLNIYQ